MVEISNGPGGDGQGRSGCGHDPRMLRDRPGNPDRGCATHGSSIASRPVMSRPWRSSTTGMPALRIP